MLLTKKTVKRLTIPYMNGDMKIAVSTSQSLNSISSKAILLIDDSKLIILFLNFFQTKVIDHIVYQRKAITNSELTNGFLGIDVVWKFTVNNRKWRFRILKKIFPLGDLQRQFIDQI
jgi:hypothetical protein